MDNKARDKFVQVGMFYEQNKERLHHEDLEKAREILEEKHSAKKIKELLSIKTKSPICASLFAGFFVWAGADKFYLGKVKDGIKKIVATVIAIVLDILTSLAFSNLRGDVTISHILQIDPSKTQILFYFKPILAPAEIFQFLALAIAVIYAIVYIVLLIRNIKQTNSITKDTNREIYNIRKVRNKVIVSEMPEEWDIG